jgi:DNA-binding NarL/FixJ family response regulator
MQPRDEAVTLAKRYNPDVVMAEMMVGHETIFPLFHALLGARIIVLTSLDADQYFFQALKAGASGFLLKDVTETELTHSIRAVAAGHAVICPSMTRRLLDRFDIIPPNEGRWQAPTFGKLSGREAEVLAEIAHGRSNRQISLELHLATATVKTYVSSILTKLGRDNRTELALLAWQLGLVRPALRPGPGAAARSPHRLMPDQLPCPDEWPVQLPIAS